MADVLLDLDVESLGPEVRKDDRHDFSASRKLYSYIKKRTFATFVASKEVPPSCGNGSACVWLCCGQTFPHPASIQRHVSDSHSREIEQLTGDSLRLQTRTDSPKLQQTQTDSVEESISDAVSCWIPDASRISALELIRGAGEVLLYYRYCHVQDPHVICQWQKQLCSTLHLTGKVRVATEGINGTVGGTRAATDLYVKAMLSHPTFSSMQTHDFKRSAGGTECFSDLKVGVYREIVPMGVDPEIISYRSAGTHLDPEEFHQQVKAFVESQSADSDTVLLDCRNFYESKIGQFSRCLAPDIRKFSYFPDYVDQNLDLFRDKKVLMYCTGGIRCERGSAYLRSKNVCKEVYQLKGGIHKYLEQFPDGFYRGKLFVFDERYAIAFNQDVISECRYCARPWDRYQLCSTLACCQLVLSCPSCRESGLTACCLVCQDKPRHSRHTLPQREECQCTRSRPRIPTATPPYTQAPECQ